MTDKLDFEEKFKKLWKDFGRAFEDEKQFALFYFCRGRMAGIKEQNEKQEEWSMEI